MNKAVTRRLFLLNRFKTSYPTMSSDNSPPAKKPRLSTRDPVISGLSPTPMDFTESTETESSFVSKVPSVPDSSPLPKDTSDKSPMPNVTSSPPPLSKDTFGSSPVCSDSSHSVPPDNIHVNVVFSKSDIGVSGDLDNILKRRGILMIVLKDGNMCGTEDRGSSLRFYEYIPHDFMYLAIAVRDLKSITVFSDKVKENFLETTFGEEGKLADTKVYSIARLLNDHLRGLDSSQSTSFEEQ